MPMQQLSRHCRCTISLGFEVRVALCIHTLALIPARVIFLRQPGAPSSLACTAEAFPEIAIRVQG